MTFKYRPLITLEISGLTSSRSIDRHSGATFVLFKRKYLKCSKGLFT